MLTVRLLGSWIWTAKCTAPLAQAEFIITVAFTKFGRAAKNA